MDEDEVILEHPNREKAASKATKAVVILLLLVSVALVALVLFGGWDKIEGMVPVTIAYIVLYLVIAFFVARWNRGLLPIAAALAIGLAIFAAIAGPQWLTRDKAGFTSPALSDELIGLICLIIVPVQVLLIAFAMRGFQQAWNVELEAPAGEDGGGTAPGRAVPA